jgi:hypothetical protein
MPNKPAKRVHPKLAAKKREPRVAIGYIHPPSNVCAEFMRCMVNLFVRDAYTHPGRIVRPIEYVSSANVSLARNKVVTEFLEYPGQLDWLLFIDSDMTFADDLLDVMLNAAAEAAEAVKDDPNVKGPPIIGGLCFGVRPIKIDGRPALNSVQAFPVELFPTLFTQDIENETTMHWNAYPQDSVFQVHSTGAACLLIHRSVLADARWLDDGHPLPWFRESVLWGDVCSEDHFFCLKAGSFGYPIFIDSRAKTGHVKTFIADEDGFLAQQAARAVEQEQEKSA